MGLHDKISYLHQTGNNACIWKLKLYTHELLNAEPGSSIIDVGCGAGIDTSEIAKSVAPDGKITGVDIDPGLIKAAEKLSLVSGNKNITEHIVATSSDLPYANDTFDAARSERLFQHLPMADTKSTLSEMVRVTKPGGKIVVLDTDWPSLSFHTSLDNRVERSFIDTLLKTNTNPFAARSLKELIAPLKLFNIELEVVNIPLAPANIIALLGPKFSNTEIADRPVQKNWSGLFGNIIELENAGKFQGSVNMILCHGTKNDRDQCGRTTMQM